MHPDPETPAEPIPMRGRVAIQTHGCKLNQADSSMLARQFVEAGFEVVESAADADVFILNSCTVTATADAKARQALRAAQRSNPDVFVVAAGCYAERAARELQGLDAVSLVVQNTEKDQLVGKVSAIRDQINGTKNPGAQPQTRWSAATVGAPLVADLGRSRAMVKIQEGCNQVCAYCIVPKVRGRERSIDPDLLVQQINQRVEEGFQEVVLTGTQLGSYGFDLPDADLTRLLRRILQETDIPRLRVSSLQPQEITQPLLDIWSNKRLCPHFHVPLQSGSDDVLKAMHRRYDTSMFRSAVEMVRRSIEGPGITTDVIVGFPGEGEAAFGKGLAFAESVGFSDMHVFPYSQRPGTSAHYFPDQVAPAVKKARVEKMLDMAARSSRSFRSQQIGQVRSVLWESRHFRQGQVSWSGLTDHYIRVFTNSQRDLNNTITLARMDEVNEAKVTAEVI